MARRRHGSSEQRSGSSTSNGFVAKPTAFGPKLWSWVIRRKQIDWFTLSTSELKRCLTTLDLTALGIGATLGAGAYVLAGQEAGGSSGPAVMLSFLIAAIASVLAGLCYGEFGARVPRAGSAYVYSYVTIGEIIAFYIGWDLILEYMIGNASVAAAWSGYLDSLFDGAISASLKAHLPMSVSGLGPYPDFIAFGIVMFLTCVLAFGVRESTMANNVLTVINLCVIIFVIVCGFFLANLHNWNLSEEEVQQYKTKEHPNVGKGGYFPFGISGMLTSASSCFYGFIGFDAIVTTAEEAKTPQRSIPLAVLISLAFVFFAYFGISTVITLMVPYPLLNTAAPLPHAFELHGWYWAKIIISIGALCALTASLFGGMFPMPRIVYAMGSDGLIFKTLAKVNRRTKTPLLATFLIGIFTGSFAMLFALDDLINMMSIGTLMAYALVAICVIILRYSSEEFPKSRPAPENLSLNTISSTHGINALSAVVDPLPADERATRSAIERGPFYWRRIAPVGQSAGIYRPNYPTEQSSVLVNTTLGVYVVCCFLLSSSISYLQPISPFAWIATGILIVIVLSCVMVIYMQPTNPQKLAFRVPLAPFLPLLSILINSYLMISLPGPTWIRFVVWLVLGMFVYMLYGIRHSRAPLRGQELTGEELEVRNSGAGRPEGFTREMGGVNVNDEFAVRET